jgi:hypothetical protein
MIIFPVSGSGNNITYPTDTSIINIVNSFSTPDTPLQQGIQNGVFQNLGHLYETRLIGDCEVLYCPGFPDTSLVSAAQYSTPAFPSTGFDGPMRSSMLFNPQVVNPMGPLPVDTIRLFPKTSSIIPGRLFGTDDLQAQTNYISGPYKGFGTSTNPSFTPNTFAHYPSHGFNILFTDGSIKFVQSAQAFSYFPQLGDQNSGYSKLFQMLENAP